MHEAIKRRSDSGLQQIQQHEPSDRQTKASVHEIAANTIHQIPQHLNAEDCDGEPPAPQSAPKPAYSGAEQGRAKQGEERSDDPSVRCELRVCCRIQAP